MGSVSVSLTGKPTKRHRHFYVILVVAVLTLAIMIGIVIFLLGVGNTNYGPGPVNIEVTTDKPLYLQGEEIQFSIYVNNPQNWPVPYPTYVALRAKGTDVQPVDIYNVNINPPLDSISTFPPHSRTLWDTAVLWDQKIDRNGTLVQPGNYTVVVSFDGLVNYGDGGNCTIEIQ